MRKLAVFAAFLIAVVFASCEQENPIVNFKMSGELSVQLLDSADNPIPNQELTLSNGSYQLSEVSTDENGFAEFGSFNIGNYTIEGNNIDENGLKYNFEKIVQIVSGEKKQIDITPSDYSGTLTINAYHVIPTGVSSYSDTTQLKTGFIALLPFDISSPSLGLIEKYSILKKELNSTNTVTFQKVPYGNYYIYAYINENHISRVYNNYSSSNIEITENYDDITRNTIFYGNLLFDYKTSLTLDLIEVTPSSYSNINTQSLSYGNVALIPKDLYYSYFDFNQLMEIAVATKEVPNSGQVAFNNISIGTYYYLVYSDEEHYAFASSSSSNTGYKVYQFASTEGSSYNAYVFGPSLKDYSFIADYYVYSYNKGRADINVYTVKNDDYNNLNYNYRFVEKEIAAIAYSSGTTDENGEISLSTPAYQKVYIICFDTNGTMQSEYITIYSKPTSRKSISFY